PQIARADACAPPRLELKSQAHLHRVGRLMMLREPDDNRLAKKTGRRRRVNTRVYQRVERRLHHRRCARERKQPCVRVERAFDLLASRKGTASTARRDLTRQQRVRNYAVKQTRASAHNPVPLAAQPICESQPRVPVVKVVADRLLWERLELVA